MTQEEKLIAYINTYSVNGSLADFMQYIKSAAASTQAIHTGFIKLDAALDGGLHEGLYVLGAVSSIGKTSLCLQVSDQIAQHGEDVLFFSLEMSKHVLISKSLSRLTFMEDGGKGKDGFHARTSRQITTGKIESEREKQLVKIALKKYNNFGSNLYIFENNGYIGLEEIQQTVERHCAITGKRPVVIVDYLQILASYDQTGSDKKSIDHAVLTFKNISMRHKIPVLAVSSFNRDNYLNPVNMASFKESGGIEYTSDVLLGLQFKGMDEIDNKRNDAVKTIEEWRRADCRELELKILKNRNGASGNNIYFEYYPRFNFFKETAKSENTRRTKL